MERAALRREPRTRTRSRGGMARPAATPWRPHPHRGRAARRAGRARSLPRARPPEARRRGPSPNGSPGSRTPSVPRALFAGVEWWTGSLEVESSGPPARASEARSDGSRGLVGKLLETEEVAETRRRSRVWDLGRRGERFSTKQLRNWAARAGPSVSQALLGVVELTGFSFPRASRMVRFC